MIARARHAVGIGFGLTVAVLLGGCTDASNDIGEVPASPAATATANASPSIDLPERAVAPSLRVDEVASGLQHGWDLGFLPGGQMLVSQRPARLALISSTEPGASVTEVDADLADVMVRGEGGLMGMVIHPDFGSSRQFTTCQTYQSGGDPVDIRLVTWELAQDNRSASKVKNLLTGLPIKASGRHSGCRPEIAQDGSLLVGTGDTADASVPQDLTSLGGKVLRLDLKTGEPLPDNPYATADNPNQRYVYTFGHRNVQGVTPRPGTDQVFAAEHGPSVNDEINRLVAGANYGWDPSQGGAVQAYDESVPMTDTQRFPDAVSAVWQSGQDTQAICDAAFLQGEQWGSFDGALAVTALKGSKVLVMTLDSVGTVTNVSIPNELDGTHGRLRAAGLGPDGALYLTTSNGDNDTLLRVMPT